MAPPEERFRHVLPFRQDSHSLSLADRGPVDGLLCDCFAICTTGDPGTSCWRIRQPRFRIVTGDYSAGTEITFRSDNHSGDLYESTL